MKFTIEDRIIKENPTPQTALDIFKGIWVSKLPGIYANCVAGSIPLFDDTRIPDGVKYLGPVEGKRVLDLGPLEGGQAYVLEQMGASRVVSVEANSILYLKCLVAKEILGMKKVNFLCGDVVEYLKNTIEQFDLCVASGILYHMTNPVELLWLLSQKVNQLLIWTHFYDFTNLTRNKFNFRGSSIYTFQNIPYVYYRQEYNEGYESDVYCGGMERYSSWMTREQILLALDNFEYTDVNVLYDTDTVHGPALLLTASK